MKENSIRVVQDGEDSRDQFRNRRSVKNPGSVILNRIQDLGKSEGTDGAHFFDGKAGVVWSDDCGG